MSQIQKLFNTSLKPFLKNNVVERTLDNMEVSLSKYKVSALGVNYDSMEDGVSNSLYPTLNPSIEAVHAVTVHDAQVFDVSDEKLQVHSEEESADMVKQLCEFITPKDADSKGKAGDDEVITKVVDYKFLHEKIVDENPIGEQNASGSIIVKQLSVETSMESVITTNDSFDAEAFGGKKLVEGSSAATAINGERQEVDVPAEGRVFEATKKEIQISKVQNRTTGLEEAETTSNVVNCLSMSQNKCVPTLINQYELAAVSFSRKSKENIDSDCKDILINNSNSLSANNNKAQVLRWLMGLIRYIYR